MSSKNRSFAAGLIGSLDEAAPQPEAPTRMPVGILASRENRMAELASGAVVGRVIEQVDPARCRLWSEHNRDYAALDETCLLYTSPSPRDQRGSRMPSSA